MIINKHKEEPAGDRKPSQRKSFLSKGIFSSNGDPLPSKGCLGTAIFNPGFGSNSGASQAGATGQSRNCWSGCNPCDNLWLLNALLVAASYMIGRVIGRETAAHRFSDATSHKRRYTKAAGLLLLIVIATLLIGIFSFGWMMIAVVALIIGFMWSRSQVNFNKKASDYKIPYNNF